MGRALFLIMVMGPLSTLLLGCGGASPPPIEQPEPARSEEPSLTAEPTSDAAQGAEAREADAEPGAAAPAPPPRRDDSVPDDYALMHGDCVELGKRLTGLTRSEQVAALSAKLTAEQRSETEKKIDAVAATLGDQYARSCEQNVGKSVDPKSLKCAFDARTVKVFEACLNGSPSAQ
ncbi:hypothetical protein WME79_08965 [Sorangium sp. So ce726]|uniref:hypothetical protein n=1 Tax=Sorangium sp. So ce726 TaxID=3133319 RepID=UPI003F602DDD